MIARLRHSEDRNTGKRLEQAGYRVAFEPKCLIQPLAQNTLSRSQCLERHWRWYVARQGRMSLLDLKRWGALAWRSMVVKDIKARDPLRP